MKIIAVLDVPEGEICGSNTVSNCRHLEEGFCSIYSGTGIKMKRLKHEWEEVYRGIYGRLDMASRYSKFQQCKEAEINE